MKDIQPIYKVNDRCYAPDIRGHVYSATIKKIVHGYRETSMHEHATKYLVHFMGWNSRYDLWITEDKLLPDTDESRLAAQQVQNQLKQEQNSRKNKKNAPVQKLTDKKKSNPEKRNRIYKDGSRELLSPNNDEDVSKECQILIDSCKLPIGLQNILVQEYLYLNPLGTKTLKGQQKMRRLDSQKRREHDLPAGIHVHRILRKFAKVSIGEKTQQSNMDKNVVRDEIITMKQTYKDFARDMCLLFDVALPKFLLYEFEREQYHRLLRPLETLTDKETLENKSNRKGALGNRGAGSGGSSGVNESKMSQVYSGGYLLRLIIKLPFLLSSIQSEASAKKKDSPSSILLKWKVAYHSQSMNVAKLMSELVCFLDTYKSQIFKGNYLPEHADE
mmetsp:Transcript_8351/g.15754  ORF Transcript_8351/g.15754 Transcript_8351/m.15754 type:complete len:388 (-) Transcript_8351:77-1240(-)